MRRFSVADQPISGLGTFPASPTSATGTSADEIEFLDVNDTTMASTGTNKRVNMADFFSTFVTAGSNVTVTKQTAGGGVQIAASGGSPGGSSGQIQTNNGAGGFGALAVPLPIASGGTGLTAWPNATTVTASIPSGQYYNLPTSIGNLTTDVTLTLPAAGTYLIWSNLRSYLNVTTSTTAGVSTSIVFAIGRLYDSTNSVAVPNSQLLIFLSGLQAAFSGQLIAYQQTATVAPVIYTVTGSAVIHIQGLYGVASGAAVQTGSGSNGPAFTSDANGSTYVTAVRLY
jgi:hypothetical protein